MLRRMGQEKKSNLLKTSEKNQTAQPLSSRRLDIVHEFSIDQVNEMVDYHKQNYNYNINFAQVGKVVLSGNSITFILG